MDQIKETTAKMQKAMEHLTREFGKVRTGRANLSILDGIRVEYYGTMSPLNQVASLNVPDPRMITIKPWEKSLVPAIEKAIMKSDLAGGQLPSARFGANAAWWAIMILALNLAAEYARTRKVLVADMDLALGDLGILADVSPTVTVAEQASVSP